MWREKEIISNTFSSIQLCLYNFSGTAEFVIKFILLMFMAFGKDLRPVYQLNEAFKVSIVKYVILEKLIYNYNVSELRS